MKPLLFFVLFLPFFCHAQPVVAVVGGGPAGLSAGTILQELGYQTVLFTNNKEDPAQDTQTSFWPGTSTWTAAIKNLRDAFTKAGGTIVEKEVTKISPYYESFVVSQGKESLTVNALIMATGKHCMPSSFSHRQSERILSNIWATTTFLPKSTVILIGQGEPLFLATLMVAPSAAQVRVFPYRGNEPSLIALSNLFPSITIMRSCQIVDIGSTKERAFLIYKDNNNQLRKEASYLVVAEEKTPSSTLVQSLCALDSSKAIIASNETGETSVAGLFACGEVAGQKTLTGLQSVGEGQKVGFAVASFLIAKGIAPKKQ